MTGVYSADPLIAACPIESQRDATACNKPLLFATFRTRRVRLADLPDTILRGVNASRRRSLIGERNPLAEAIQPGNSVALLLNENFGNRRSGEQERSGGP
jgi:hypothetical protein